jgi:murein DD-endopeptidase MepM/ murein hydrolase activator NlpD
MGTRPDPMNSGKTQNHQGVDVAAPGGTPIYATMDGQARKYTNSPTAGNYVFCVTRCENLPLSTTAV